MFRVRVDERDLGFEFRYGKDEHRDYGVRRTTTCYIKEADGKIVMQGRVICDGRDQFCKENGRKRSLTLALKNLTDSEYLNDADAENDIDVKAIRFAFWTVYLSRRVIATKQMA